MKKKRTAFSLAELSIVVIIIGILISGVLGGTKLLKGAALSNARALTNSSPVASIKGLVLWLETTSKKSFDFVPIEASSITKWNDINPQSNNLNHALEVSGSAPTYIEKEINDLPALYFDGVENRLQIAHSSSLAMTGDFAIFCVIKLSDVSQWQIIINKDTSFKPNPWEFRIDQTTGRSTVMLGDGTSYAQATSSPSITIGRPVILGLNVIGDDVTHYHNGLAVANFTSLTSVPRADSGGTVLIGRRPDGLTFKGHIAEIIIFNKKLRNSQIEAIEKYLSQKWDINLN